MSASSAGAGAGAASASPIVSDLIAREWAGFERAVIPAVAGEIQRREMRLAFFGGAAALLFSVMRILDSGDEPTERDMAQMAAIQAELDAFAASMGVKTGRKLQ